MYLTKLFSFGFIFFRYPFHCSFIRQSSINPTSLTPMAERASTLPRQWSHQFSMQKWYLNYFLCWMVECRWATDISKILVARKSFKNVNMLIQDGIRNIFRFSRWSNLKQNGQFRSTTIQDLQESLFRALRDSLLCLSANFRSIDWNLFALLLQHWRLSLWKRIFHRLALWEWMLRLMYSSLVRHCMRILSSCMILRWGTIRWKTTWDMSQFANFLYLARRYGLEQALFMQMKLSMASLGKQG